MSAVGHSRSVWDCLRALEGNWQVGCLGSNMCPPASILPHSCPTAPAARGLGDRLEADGRRLGLEAVVIRGNDPRDSIGKCAFESAISNICPAIQENALRNYACLTDIAL